MRPETVARRAAERLAAQRASFDHLAQRLREAASAGGPMADEYAAMLAEHLAQGRP